MALGQTRVNGGAQPTELVGRNLEWVLVTLANVHVSYTAVDSDFEKVVRTLETFGTATIVGTPASNNVHVVMEGYSANATVTETAIDAATGGSSTVDITAGLSGNTFA